jgi:hypothetical protein
MFSMKKWMLGAAVLAGGLGLGTMQAKAAEFGVYVRGPVAYVPPCPGPGYAWVAGYYANGYWVPGRWNFISVRGPAPIARFDYRRDFARDHGWDRNHFDHDHFRR